MDFISNLEGTLVKLEEDPNSRFNFEIWFDYTRSAMSLIREGAMLAVPNFSSNHQEEHLSILEIISILPQHYALGNEAQGYPGFIIEAARNAVSDWEEQEYEATEDVTKIRAIAIPTNLELVRSSKDAHDPPDLQVETNIPMIGATTLLLDTEFTKYVLNFGIYESENTLMAGSLIRDSQVDMHVRIEDMMRTHFGIFGFTGAGKSNLVSTLIRNLISQSAEPVKVILFDLMGEYTALLVDLLCRIKSSRIICIDERTIPEPVVQFLNGKDDLLDSASEVFAKTLLLPKALKPYEDQFARALKYIVKNKRIKLWQMEEDVTVDDAIRETNPWKARKPGYKYYQDISNIVGSVFGEYKDKKVKLTAELASSLLEKLRRHEKYGDYSGDFLDLENFLMQVIEISKLKVLWKISTNDLISGLNSSSESTIYIVQAYDPNRLREFAKKIGDRLYEERRKTGIIFPLVSFIFDEADEFIPQSSEGSYQDSREIAMTLARRGRKFGLGIGIATQRVRYLDTSIMAQPHTYFVSKMPRITDREVVAQAFGVSEDLFRQTFKFKKGDWLLMSYDATGLEAIPIPIHCEDANLSVKAFLDEAIKRGDTRQGK